MQKTGIICASDEELEPFLRHIENPKTTEKARLTFYEGTIAGVPVVAAYSGVCKVNAAIAAQLMIDTFQTAALINAGTAGGMDERVLLFDTVISTEVAYHDVDDEILTEFHPWLPHIYFTADENLLRVAKQIASGNSRIHFGRMVTGEKFIEDHMRAAIRLKYAPLSADMETAGIAQVCYAYKIPFIAIRSITDTPSHSGMENFEKNCRQASVTAKDVVLDFLKAMNGQVS